MLFLDQVFVFSGIVEVSEIGFPCVVVSGDVDTFSVGASSNSSALDCCRLGKCPHGFCLGGLGMMGKSLEYRSFVNFLYGNAPVCVMFPYKLLVVFLLSKRTLNHGLLSSLLKVFSSPTKSKDGYNVIFYCKQENGI